jgi:hypothetical protein
VSEPEFRLLALTWVLPSSALRQAVGVLAKQIPMSFEPSRAPPLAAPPPLWRRALPWVIGSALLAFVLTRTEADAVWQSLRSVNPLGYLAFVLAFSLVNLSADALASFRVYRLVAPALSFRDIVVVRGASYLPTLLNYHLGQAYLTYLLAQCYRAPIRRVISGTLLSYATMLMGLIALAGLSLPLKAHPPWLRQLTALLSRRATFAHVLVRSSWRSDALRPLLARAPTNACSGTYSPASFTTRSYSLRLRQNSPTVYGRAHPVVSDCVMQAHAAVLVGTMRDALNH